MPTMLPLKTIQCVIYLSFVGYVSWRTILSIVSGKFSINEPLPPL